MGITEIKGVVYRHKKNKSAYIAETIINRNELITGSMPYVFYNKVKLDDSVKLSIKMQLKNYDIIQVTMLIKDQSV